LAIAVFSTLFYFKQDTFSSSIWIAIFIGILVILSILIIFTKLSFNKKGYAFREHDAIYKSGLISETTTIIPFNRVQHVALHQGFISRKLGLASVELFTAGGNSSDLEIPGLLLSDAQIIKNLVSQKINPPKKAETIEVQPTESFLTEENE
jgi:membrane protein YdbS with pleckstrin-like domain